MTKTPPHKTALKGAIMSGKSLYRYALWRAWRTNGDLLMNEQGVCLDVDRPFVTWLMMNPSTAGANINDPTVTRCMNYSKQWGFDGMYVVNLYAFRDTDWAHMLELGKQVNIVGPKNDEYIRRYASLGQYTIVAPGRSMLRKVEVRMRLIDVLRTLEEASLSQTLRQHWEMAHPLGWVDRVAFKDLDPVTAGDIHVD